MSDPTGSILLLLLLTGVGLAVAKVLRSPTVLRSSDDCERPTLDDGWSLLLGIAVVGLVLQIPLAINGRISHWSFAAVAAAGVVAWCWIIAGYLTGRRKLAPPAWLTGLPRWIQLALLITIGAAVVHCWTTRISGYDARTIYALKARVLDDVGSIAGEDFNDPTRVNFNPTYPLLLPLLEAQAFWCGGGYARSGLELLFLSFPLAVAAMLAAATRRVANPLFAVGTAVMFLFTPIMLRSFEGAGLSGSADLPVAALLFGGLLEMGRWLRAPNWRPAVSAALLLGAAASMKAEGALWILGASGAVALGVICRRIKPEWRQWRSAAVGAAALVVCVAVGTAIHARVHPNGYYLSYVSALDWNWIRQLSTRPLIVLRYVAADFVRPEHWNLVWPCVFGSLLLLKRKRLPAEVWFWRVTALGMATAYVLVLIITPLHVHYQLLTSVSRLLLHFYPLAVLIMAEQMAASGWAQQVTGLISSRPAPAQPAAPASAEPQPMSKAA